MFGIWKAKVPEKIRIFAWRVATETLPTKENKRKRTLEVDNICNICGKEKEDEFHAVMSCTKARALREEMRAHWELPAEDQCRFNGDDWLQNLLGRCDAEGRRKLLLLLWRAWWLRDDCIHADGRATINQSVQFLLKYVDEIKMDKTDCSAGDRAIPPVVLPFDRAADSRRAEIKEGKKVQGTNTCIRRNSVREGDQADKPDEMPVHSGSGDEGQWVPPVEGIWKMNSDAAFLPSSGESTAGVVVRNHLGMVALCSGQRLQLCSSPEEAELNAILHGLSVLTKYYQGPVCVESDCATAVSLLNNRGSNQSAFFPLITDVWNLEKKVAAITYKTVRRDKNKLAHEIAAHVRRQGDYFSFGDVPPNLRSILIEDCNSSVK